MRAKACTTCRQCKVRCDIEAEYPNDCSRCQGKGRKCVFDRNFKRVHKHRRALELEKELEDLRRASTHPSSEPPAGALPSPHPTIQYPTPPIESVESPRQLDYTCFAPKAIGADVCLTAAQVTELYQIFFRQYHPWLPMHICRSPEPVYKRCPLLFWAICAVASSAKPNLAIESHITGLISAIVTSPSRSVDNIQALAILCLWPFSYKRTLDDPSYMYGALAMQLARQLGLQRPGFVHEYSTKMEVLEINDETRTSTWMACCVVTQLQALRLGVPSGFHDKFRMPQGVTSSPTLEALYRLSKFSAKVNVAMGASSQSASGLVNAHSRVELAKLFVSELDLFEQSQSEQEDISQPQALPSHSSSSLTFPIAPLAINFAFLDSRMQLWSFLLIDDVSHSENIIPLLHRANKDTVQTISLASLGTDPAWPISLCRQVAVAALLLIKILWSAYGQIMNRDLIHKVVEQAAQALSCTVKVADDHVSRACQLLRDLLTVKGDKKKYRPVHSRTSANIIFGAVRVRNEHLLNGHETLVRQNVALQSGEAMETPDLDGLDWWPPDSMF